MSPEAKKDANFYRRHLYSTTKRARSAKWLQALPGTDVHNQPKIHIEIRLKTHIFPRTFADLLPLCYDNITRF